VRDVLEKMLMFMVQGGKDTFGADEVAAALGVPESEVTPLYKRARDMGWVEKFSDRPPMFRLTGPGWSEASRLLSTSGLAQPRN
jgi:hypothetical protein